MIDYTFYALFFIFLALVILGLWSRVAKHARIRRPYNGPLETDLRLTYKRFKELYPHSQMTYQEYKKLQAQKAYKRAVSSQKIKRMVR